MILYISGPISSWMDTYKAEFDAAESYLSTWKGHTVLNPASHPLGLKYEDYMQIDAEMIRDSWSGLKVPKKALRVDETGQSGVYCMVGLAARFKPVSITFTGEDFCLVEADDPKNETLRIREGDQVIISAKDLYDGKIVG